MTAPGEAELLSFALTFPEAWEDHPWGERVVKVRKKVFVFFGLPGDRLHMWVKLPVSGPMALAQTGCSPATYGMGQHGWVAVDLGPDDEIPTDVLRDWIAESYRAVAPKSLVAALAR